MTNDSRAPAPESWPDQEAVLWLDSDPKRRFLSPGEREVVLRAFVAGRDGARRVGLGRDGEDLLREAWVLLLEYERIHRAKVARIRGPHGRRSLVKADRNAELGGRIEAYLAVEDPELQRMARIWQWGADQRNDMMDSAIEAGQASRCRVCGCSKARPCIIPAGSQYPYPCRWADKTETLCDNPACLAAVAAQGVGLVREAVSPPPAAPASQAPLEGAHDADCECEACWKLIPTGAIESAPTKEIKQ